MMTMLIPKLLNKALMTIPLLQYIYGSPVAASGGGDRIFAKAGKMRERKA